jgi:hypothetical protein
MSSDSTSIKPIRLCSFPGCDKPFRSKQLCMGHYAQLRIGTPLRPLFSTQRVPGTPPRMEYDEQPCPRLGTPCHIFRGAKVQDGYGSVGWKGKVIGAHVYAYIKAFGAIEKGAVIRHQCDIPPCINPHHLEKGSHADNARDKVARGRMKPVEGEANPNSKLLASQVVDIRSRYAGGELQVDLASEFGVAQPQISAIVLRKTWKTV